jgi:hypothetical protein
MVALKEGLKREFLEMLKTDEEFRYAVAGLLGLDTILNELKMFREDFKKYIELEGEIWRENSKRWEENNRRWEENNKRWEDNNRRWEEAYKRLEAIELELKTLREDFNKTSKSFEIKLMALGARWGLESEYAFREAVRGIVERILGAGKVSKWRYYDANGEVLGYPAYIESDVLIRDDTHILVEVKSSASDGDVSKLWKIGNLYCRVVGVKPKLILVTPFIDEKGLNAAEKLSVEVYTKI